MDTKQLITLMRQGAKMSTRKMSELDIEQLFNSLSCAADELEADEIASTRKMFKWPSEGLRRVRPGFIVVEADTVEEARGKVRDRAEVFAKGEISRYLNDNEWTEKDRLHAAELAIKLQLDVQGKPESYIDFPVDVEFIWGNE